MPSINNKTNTAIEREQFLREQVAIWGRSYVCDLIDRGYLPVFIEGLGWRFVLTDR